MLDSILLYAGAIAAGGGAAGTLSRRCRRPSVVIAAAGVLTMAGALGWPAREHRTGEGETHLDEVIPVWQFGEVHEIDVAASQERTFESCRNVTASEIALYRTLTFIRRFGIGGRESILNPPKDEPILAVATRSGFRVLAEDAPRELVLATRIAPGTIAVMNFLITPKPGGGVRLSTETRVHATTSRERRAFAIYWRIIHPGSDIIRRMWLRAIRQRAERG